MTEKSLPPTPTDLLVAATSVLEAGGYKIVEDTSDWNTTSSRLFEDDYGVVGIAVFLTCGELIESWASAQGSLVEVISRSVGAAESKAWDGYLVLLTPAPAPTDASEIEAIRYNTTRLRKFVATGEELGSAGDVARVLLPLLPLHKEDLAIRDGSVLDLLPELLSQRGISRDSTATLVKAFQEQEPLMEALHRSWGKS